MTKEELTATFGPPLVGLVATLLTLALYYVRALVNAHVTNVNFKTASLKLTDLAETTVKAAEQTTVQRLKDPDAPGAWTPEGAAELKKELTDQLMSSFKDAQKIAKDLGLATVDDLRKLVEQTLEAKVLDLRRAPEASLEKVIK